MHAHPTEICPEAKAVFEKHDGEKSGLLTHAEFTAALTELHNGVLIPKIEAESKEEWSEHSKDGKLSLADFDHIVKELKHAHGPQHGHHHGQHCAKAKAVFEKHDDDKCGHLTHDEFVAALTELHEGKLDPKIAAEAQNEWAEHSKDGKLGFHDFDHIVKELKVFAEKK
jgi:Ca2+-binding EF-hand superfamily protein